jgi:hypothetical protein
LGEEERETAEEEKNESGPRVGHRKGKGESEMVVRREKEGALASDLSI